MAKKRNKRKGEEGKRAGKRGGGPLERVANVGGTHVENKKGKKEHNGMKGEVKTKEEKPEN